MMTAFNFTFNSICEVNKDTIIAVGIQFAIIAVGGYNTPFIFWTEQLPCFGTGETVPFTWVELPGCSSGMFLSK